MQKYYFTYGSSGQPFSGGWTEVFAPDMQTACDAFKAFHPNTKTGCLDCSFIYTEEQFKEAKMAGPEGNFGAFCQEVITLQRLLMDE